MLKEMAISEVYIEKKTVFGTSISMWTGSSGIGVRL
jgi:hypothetical protein